MTYHTAYGKTFNTYNDYIQSLLERENKHPGLYDFYPNRMKHDNSKDSESPDME